MEVEEIETCGCQSLAAILILVPTKRLGAAAV
jgi:hypothetical protein